ncbi:hypothetical protein GX51_04639 [Blastomyces parvus]|uniref:Kinesin motor domain-containing protein n=1 Tax=Blastomyces parvus TaxID=2060905 RepID=A0A2B7X102_9EURO|nr:hypothetical protein GX51_04639 [Blastomyces parvus]
MDSTRVYARWRPLSRPEAQRGEIHRATTPSSQPLHSISIKRQSPGQDHPWTSPPAFNAVFTPDDNNRTVYNAVVAPTIPRMLRGENCSFFAYGHSGSGKTHTILGYDFQDTQELGLCLAAAKELFDALHRLSDQPEMAGGNRMGIGFSLFELRRKTAFDLLNHRTQCHVREGPDGKVHVRGETETLQDGRVRVRPIVQRACWDFGSLRGELVQALTQRATGTSTVHDQSSRTHAVLELEVVSQPLVDARLELYDRQSELVPVGKRAIDVRVEEDMRGVIQGPDGKWAPNPDYQRDQARVDAVEAEQAEFEGRVTAAEEKIEDILKSSASPCLGAKMVFVDLAGAEYYDGNGAGSNGVQSRKQTPQELQEGRQINTDLLALKEVMRAWSQGQKRIPFRSSTLTMVLREHFMRTGKGNSTIIVTVSPAAEQYAATLNSLKYASLVGAPST